MTRRPRCAFWTVRFLVRLLEIANNELREINDTFVRCCDMGTVLQGISDGGYMDTLPKIEEAPTAAPTERLANSVEEAAGDRAGIAAASRCIRPAYSGRFWHRDWSMQAATS